MRHENFCRPILDDFASLRWVFDCDGRGIDHRYCPFYAPKKADRISGATDECQHLRRDFYKRHGDSCVSKAARNDSVKRMVKGLMAYVKE